MKLPSLEILAGASMNHVPAYSHVAVWIGTAIMLVVLLGLLIAVLRGGRGGGRPVRLRLRRRRSR